MQTIWTSLLVVAGATMLRAQGTVTPLPIPEPPQSPRSGVEWFRWQDDLARVRVRIASELAHVELLRSEAEKTRAVLESARMPAAPWFDNAGIAPAPWAGQDPGDSTYRSAREALNRGEWGTAVAAFRTLLQKYPKSVYAAESGYYQAFALFRIGGTPQLQEALAVLEAQSARYPSAHSRAEAVTLATRIQGVLAARGVASAREALARIPTEQTPSCDREEQLIQAEAMRALSRSGAANVTELITRVLARRDECAAPLRRTAIFLVASRHDSQAVGMLAGVARNDPSVDVRTMAIEVLGSLSGPEATEVLSELTHADNEQVQRTAVRALVHRAGADGRQVVRELVERQDLSEKLRAEALYSFDADDATADDVAWLRSLYAGQSSTRLKSAILRTIVRADGSDVDQWLAGIAGNESESGELRSIALRRIAATMSVADLGKMYDGATQQGFRQEIIGFLGQRKGDAATDKLIDIVKNGTDLSLRRSAIGALAGRKDDSRAMQLLLEVVNK